MTQYNSEFKLLVAQKAQKARTYAEVGREYGVNVSNVKTWAKEYKQYGELAFEEDGPKKFEEQRIRALEKRVEELEEENEILKKAAAIFSKSRQTKSSSL